MIALAFLLGFTAGCLAIAIALAWWAMRGAEPAAARPPERAAFVRCGVCRATYPCGWWHQCADREVARG